MAKMSKYEAVVKPKLDEIKEARANGASFDDLAKALGVGRTSLYKWMDVYEDFKQAMDEAEIALHNKIEFTAHTSLIDKLTDRLVVFEQIVEDGVVIREKRKLIPADTTAIIFALKARNPQKWDSLGVARLKDDEKQKDINDQILSTLEKYKPKGNEV